MTVIAIPASSAAVVVDQPARSSRRGRGRPARPGRLQSGRRRRPGRGPARPRGPSATGRPQARNDLGAAAVTDRDPLLGQQPGGGLAGERSGPQRRSRGASGLPVPSWSRLVGSVTVDQPAGAGRSHVTEQLPPGRGALLGGRRGPARVPVRVASGQLTLGEPGLVGVDVDLLGVDPDAQLGGSGPTNRVSSRTGSSTTGTWPSSCATDVLRPVEADAACGGVDRVRAAAARGCRQLAQLGASSSRMRRSTGAVAFGAARALAERAGPGSRAARRTPDRAACWCSTATAVSSAADPGQLLAGLRPCQPPPPSRAIGRSSTASVQDRAQRREADARLRRRGPRWCGRRPGTAAGT